MIIGAGLSGLIAAFVFPTETIVEAAPRPQQSHKALLRFRTNKISDLTGIPFREVTVRKGIYYGGTFVKPCIAIANMHSVKCMGSRLLGDRSIWNIDTVQRFIAPEDFYQQLVRIMESRIEWDIKVDFRKLQMDTAIYTAPVISTAPLHLTLKALGIETAQQFARAPITVQRFRVPNCDVHQTIYFPTRLHTLYRASITGDLMICEHIGSPAGDYISELFESFSLPDTVDELEAVEQQYGKIVPIDERERKQLIYRLSMKHNLFSLGRFAVWKNLLLDDVLEDAFIVKKLMRASPYEQFKAQL
jgi:hypothetical protein